MLLDHQLVRSLVGLDPGLSLHREHLLQGGHSDLDHVVGRLARSQLLQLQARPDEQLHNRVLLVPRAPHDELERDTRHQRYHDEPAQHHEQPPLDPEQREYQDAQDQHVQYEARPAADVAGVQPASVLGDELLTVLVDLYGFVLGSVGGEKALHVLADQGYTDQVGDEDRDPDPALDQVEEHGMLDAVAHKRAYPFCPEHRRHQEEPEAEHGREPEGKRDLPLGEVFFLTERDVSRQRQRLHAKPEGLAQGESAADYREPEELAPARDRAEALGPEVELSRRRADGHSPEVGGAHQHTLHYGLPPDPHGRALLPVLAGLASVLEPLHPAAGVHDALPARVEGVARARDVELDQRVGFPILPLYGPLRLYRRAGQDREVRAPVAKDHGPVLRVYALLHRF